MTVAVQLFSGLGAGNIGDELMTRGFWRSIPKSLQLEVVLARESVRYRGEYPPPHSYVVDRTRWRNRRLPRLIVGTTPVSEQLGLGFPLNHLARIVAPLHRRGIPVDAVGVGVEPLESSGARALFADHLLPLRSWSVRSEACRTALEALGVAPERIRVGADWAWAFRGARDESSWAAQQWRALGVTAERRLLVVNVVNEGRGDRDRVRRGMATALDQAAERWDAQIAFLCHESRDGAFYDHAAAQETARLMRHSAVIVPNLYYTPDETLALLRAASATVGERFHFAIASVLAGVPPILVRRGPKTSALADETGIQLVGSPGVGDPGELEAALASVLDDRPRWTKLLTEVRSTMEARTANNLSLIAHLAPYDALLAPHAPL